MQDESVTKNLGKMIRMGYVVLFMIAAILLFRYILPILGDLASYIPNLLMPLIVAIVLAAIMEPLVSLLERAVGRLWATLLSFIIVLGGFLLVLTLLLVTAIKQITTLYITTMSNSDKIIQVTMQYVSNIKLFFLQTNIPPEMRDFLEKTMTSAASFLKDLLGNIMTGLGSGLTTVPEAIMFILIASVATFFVIKDQALIIRFLERALPARIMDKASTVTAKLFQTLVGFIRGYFIIMVITAIITAAGLGLMGIDSAIMLGIIIAILDLIPIIGSGIVFIPWMIVDLAMGAPVQAAELLGLWVGVGIIRQIIEPKIVGDNIGLHPLVSLVSLYAGLKVAGFIGMILGPVTVVIFLAMVRAGVFESLTPWLKMPEDQECEGEGSVAMGEGTDE